MNKSVYIVVNIAVDVKEGPDGETAMLLARLLNGSRHLVFLWWVAPSGDDTRIPRCILYSESPAPSPRSGQP